MFEKANVTMRERAATELERFSAKISEVETQMQTLAPQRELAQLRAGAPGSSATAPSVVQTQRLTDSNLVDSLSDKEFMLERQIDEQKRLITEQEKVVKSAGPTSALASSSAYGVLLARRAEVEGQIKDLSTYATEKNPKLIQARTQLSEINREITRLESTSGTNPNALAAAPEARELRKMQSDLLRLQTELEVTRRDLNRKTERLNTLPSAEATGSAGVNVSPTRLNELKAEYDRLLARYNWLRDKQDSMQKLSGVAGQNLTMFQVIDAPHATRTPVGPNRNLLRLLGLGVSLGLGFLVAGARAFPRMLLINNDRDVEYYLGTPVLAVVPETLTPFERSRRRRLWLLRTVMLTLLAAMMVPVFVIALDRLQIFQILGSR